MALPHVNHKLVTPGRVQTGHPCEALPAPVSTLALLQSATSICPHIYSAKCSTGMSSPVTEITGRIRERRIPKRLAGPRRGRALDRGTYVTPLLSKAQDVTHVSDGDGLQTRTWSIRIISKNVSLLGHKTDRYSFRTHSATLLFQVKKKVISGLTRWLHW